MVTTMHDGSELDWTAIEWHFHAPAEHRLDGVEHDAELHFVHFKKDSFMFDNLNGSVIGVIFDRAAGGNKENPFLKSFFDSVDHIGDGVNGNQPEIKISDFLESIDTEHYWTYDGSLTTPPCTEGIVWNVIKQVQPISDAQLKRFTEFLADDPNFAGGRGNNRGVQDLHGREVWQSDGATLGGFNAKAPNLNENSVIQGEPKVSTN